MSPVTHFLAGWLLAEAPSVAKQAVFTRRDKALVVAAAVASIKARKFRDDLLLKKFLKLRNKMHTGTD